MRSSVLWGEIEIYGDWDGEIFIPDDFLMPNDAAKKNMLEILEEHIDHHSPGYLEREAAASVEEERQWTKENRREIARAAEIERIRRVG
jgi:hypothetical protein